MVLNDTIRELIINNESTLKIKEEAMVEGTYMPLVIDGVKKVLAGQTTLEELNKKLIIY